MIAEDTNRRTVL